MQKCWFESWFDSPYYHILYKHRDDDEARHFLNQLISKLQLPKAAKILDLACGRGRHSVYLSGKGFDVTGLDLSPENIHFAKKLESPNLHFDVHDMRNIYKTAAFDYVLNLFTSFGYFDDRKEDQQVIMAIREMLVPGGVFILDYINAASVDASDRVYEEEIEGLTFRIRKQTKSRRLLKYIDVIDNGKIHHFREQVSVYEVSELETMFKSAGLAPIATYGNYDLLTFAPQSSERIILLGKRS